MALSMLRTVALVLSLSCMRSVNAGTCYMYNGTCGTGNCIAGAGQQCDDCTSVSKICCVLPPGAGGNDCDFTDCGSGNCVAGAGQRCEDCTSNAICTICPQSNTTAGFEYLVGDDSYQHKRPEMTARTKDSPLSFKVVGVPCEVSFGGATFKTGDTIPLTSTDGVPLKLGADSSEVLVLNLYTQWHTIFIVHAGCDPNWSEKVEVPAALPDWGAKDGYLVTIKQCPGLVTV